MPEAEDLDENSTKKLRRNMLMPGTLLLAHPLKSFGGGLYVDLGNGLYSVAKFIKIVNHEFGSFQHLVLYVWNSTLQLPTCFCIRKFLFFFIFYKVFFFL